MIIHMQVASDLWSLKFFIIREKRCWSNICACTSKFLQTNPCNFQKNSAIQSLCVRIKYHLHRPVANLLYLERSLYCAGIRIFKSLPCRQTDTHTHTHTHACARTRTHTREKAQFTVALRRCLRILFSVDEFRMLKNAS